MGIILALGLAALIGGVGISSRPPLEALLIGAKRIFVASDCARGINSPPIPSREPRVQQSSIIYICPISVYMDTVVK